MRSWRLDIRNREFNGAADASSSTANPGSHFVLSVASLPEVES